jgi:hypothetical protein
MKKLAVGVFILVLLAFTSSSFADVSFQGVNLKGGTYLRVRHEYWRNWKDMDNGQQDTRNFFRIKSSLWGQADFSKEISLLAKLTNEFRAHTFFEGTSGTYPDKTASKKGYHFNIDEVVFDNLYLDVKNFLKLPVDLRIGRQDFLGMYGEGFLIMDGTPQDGSRTFYFNAAKASWRVDPNNTLDFIYINNPRDEEFLPIINENKLVVAATPTRDKVPVLLNSTDEQAAVIYLKNKAIKNLALEGYYIYKYEAEEGGSGVYASEKTKLSTIGSYAKYSMAPYALRGQLAYQFGDYGDEDRRGVGGYAYIDRSFKEAMWSPALSVGAIYLSGNKRSSTKNEGWDPLFSKWPWISELYVLTMAGETTVVGYWTNLLAYRASLVLTPTKKTKLSLWYNFLRANDQVPASSIFSGDGRNRGHMPQVRFDYAFNKNITAYFLAEYLIPGNFYADRDPGLFLRSELQVKF